MEAQDFDFLNPALEDKPSRTKERQSQLKETSSEFGQGANKSGQAMEFKGFETWSAFFTACGIEASRVEEFEGKMIEEEYVIDQWKDLTFATLSKLGFKQGPIDRITKFISGFTTSSGSTQLSIELLAKEGFFKIPSFLDGLPKLGRMCGSSSSASESLEHKKAKLLVQTFKPLNPMPTSHRLPSAIWTTLSGRDALEWGSEADIQGFVKLVITDAISAVGLVKELNCFNELGVARLRPDIWVILSATGTPIGVVEVKKPSKNIMESERIHGQIYDYMKRLRTFYGQESVFGIVSTYEKWRIYWLNEQPSIDAAKAEAVQHQQRKLRIEEPDVIPDMTGNTGGDHLMLATPFKRKVQGSETYSWDDSTLPSILMSVILKMNSSGNYAVRLVDINRHYIQLNKLSWFWNPLPNGLKLDYGTLPSKSTKNLFLLHDLKGGAHGRVWLACNGSGKVCVLKFAQDKENGEEMLKNECQIWSIWKLPARVEKWCGEPALVMPFVKPASSTWDQPEVQSAVTEAVEQLAKAGYKHQDLHQRHVGLYKWKGKLNALLFDLSHVLAIQSDDQTLAIQEMMKKLKLR